MVYTTAARNEEYILPIIFNREVVIQISTLIVSHKVGIY